MISFGANAEGAPVLAAMQMLPDVLAYRSRLPAPLIPAKMIDAAMVNGPWKRLVPATCPRGWHGEPARVAGPPGWLMPARSAARGVVRKTPVPPDRSSRPVRRPAGTRTWAVVTLPRALPHDRIAAV